MEIKDEGPKPDRTVPIEFRWEIVKLKEESLSGIEVGEILHRPASTCNGIYWKFVDTGSVKDLPRSGRPLKATEDVQKKLLNQIGRGTEQSVDQIIEEAKMDLSNRSARRILKSKKIKCRQQAESGPSLSNTRKRDLLRQNDILVCLMNTGKKWYLRTKVKYKGIQQSLDTGCLKTARSLQSRL